jgi:hypothetical protein
MFSIGIDMDIVKLLGEIIPPADYSHRNGFNNTNLINQLNEYEWEQVEDALINKLLDKTDLLVVETLGYMKSEKSLSVLYNLLEKTSDEMEKLVIATSIFEINKDNRLIDIGMKAFKRLSTKSSIYTKDSITSAFFYLIKFEDAEVNNLIKTYTEHSDYLVSYNAKRALDI